MAKYPTRSDALKDPASHQFVFGMGYVKHALPPPTGPAPADVQDCHPPAGTPDGSRHVLRRRPLGEPVDMTWGAATRTWRPALASQQAGAARMAFTPGHLSSAGWEYVGPAPEPAPPANDET